MQEDLADVMARVARTLHENQSVEETLDAVVHAVRATVPGVRHAGISIGRRDGTIETVAGTDDVVWRIDALQYELGEGPCVDAILGRTRTIVNDIGADERWPNFAPRATALDVRSQLGVELFNESSGVGGLNLYSSEVGAFDEEVVHVLEIFASHAAQALGKSMREEQLQEALRSRRLIGQAIGIVMERYQLDQQRAFDYLIRVSQQSNVKLRTLAAELVEQLDDRARQSARPAPAPPPLDGLAAPSGERA
ncbi:GAF and ANTAR domain-containing protein [Desertihabitans aurantiacus]|uniref:GAF and ANTAR domain-containing protein n=1 Tax=Desertihabitans aurantiacus TaxID=2282477 RepID=UPI000DF772BD|nr:GAF and ANTAR domain-containing protein [Desertihabitans aurantiacus]